MSVTSDPHLESVPASHHDAWPQHARHQLIEADAEARSAALRMRRGWRSLGVLVAAVAVIYAAPVVLAAFATSLTSANAADAPAWMIELSATRPSAVTALIYGDDVGFQLVRVPPVSAGQNMPRLVPARLARGEVHFVSLSLSKLTVRASAPKGSPAMSFSATGPIITVFQNKNATGVRGGW